MVCVNRPCSTQSSNCCWLQKPLSSHAFWQGTVPTTTEAKPGSRRNYVSLYPGEQLSKLYLICFSVKQAD